MMQSPSPTPITFYETLSPAILSPFFHVELPLSAPGINQSYMPAVDENGKLTMVHTPTARQFLLQAAWYFRDQAGLKKFDRRVFEAISDAKPKEKVALDVTIKFHLKSLWRSDIDGPDKITLDALFAHFKFLADFGKTANWNDNRVTCLHVYKDVASSGVPSIEIEVRCVAGK